MCSHGKKLQQKSVKKKEKGNVSVTQMNMPNTVDASAGTLNALKVTDFHVIPEISTIKKKEETVRGKSTSKEETGMQKKKKITIGKEGGEFQFLKPNVSVDTLNNAKVNLFGKQSEKGYLTGYIGSAIVYSKEANADKLAKRYIDESNAWGEDEKRARLGVSFVFNHSNLIENANVDKQAQNLVNTTKDTMNEMEISNKMEFAKWKMSVNTKGEQSEDIELKFENFEELFDKYYFPDDEQASLETEGSQQEITSEKTKGVIESKLKSISQDNVPYGILRGIASKNAMEIEKQISKNIEPSKKPKVDVDRGSEKKKEVEKRRVYIHSVDTDAPSFLTETKEPILNRYDDILEKDFTTKKPAFLIGGYNLSEAPGYGEDFNIGDHRDTICSNLIDRMIRTVIIEKTGMLLYPTEPNFLIKATTYQKLVGLNQNLWGKKASEGFQLLLSYLKYRYKEEKLVYRKEKRVRAIGYDDSASIPTGLEGGGKRLRVFTKKTEEGIEKIVKRVEEILKSTESQGEERTTEKVEEEVEGNVQKVVQEEVKGEVEGGKIDEQMKQETIDIGKQYVIQGQSWLHPDRILHHWLRVKEQVPINVRKKSGSGEKKNDENIKIHASDEFKKEFVKFFAKHITRPIVDIISALNQEQYEKAEQILANHKDATGNELYNLLVKGKDAEEFNNIQPEYKGMLDFDGMVNEIWNKFNIFVKERRTDNRLYPPSCKNLVEKSCKKG